MQQRSPFRMIRILCVLTCSVILMQLSFIYIHYKISGLVDTLISSSFQRYIFTPIILIPILKFILINLAVYAILILWIYFLAESFARIKQLTEMQASCLGIMIWCMVSALILMANSYFYTHSFFAIVTDKAVLIFSLISLTTVLVMMTIAALYDSFKRRRQRLLACLLLSVTMVVLLMQGAGYFHQSISFSGTPKQPNIIIISFDSLRPDFLDYFHGPVSTPNIDTFLRNSTLFKDAYTPLARTFPSWISILTGQYPIHTNTRNNLINPALIKTKETFTKQLQQAGYQTMYATDEKRFSNITEAQGFDTIVGPKMGLNDFILGSLGDFPLTNLLVNLTISKYLFPYQFANRAAAVTYDPNNFFSLVQEGLAQRSRKPLFLAVHFCLSHWPYTWANDHATNETSTLLSYKQSIKMIDVQFGKMLTLLKQQHLLSNSLLIVISDHGTGLGLPGDQVIASQKYLGKSDDIKKLHVMRLSSADPFSMDYKHDYTINTSYGQGTSLLSLSQYHVLLAMQGFGVKTMPASINGRASLLDIAPTILQLLHLPPAMKMDGVSLIDSLNQGMNLAADRELYFETGDKVSYIETDHISPEKVLGARIFAYEMDSKTGKIFLNENGQTSLIQNKQLGIMSGDWLLVQFPTEMVTKMKLIDHKVALVGEKVPSFDVLVNMRTGQWSVGYSPLLSTRAQLTMLQDKLMHFYSK